MKNKSNQNIHKSHHIFATILIFILIISIIAVSAAYWGYNVILKTPEVSYSKASATPQQSLIKASNGTTIWRSTRFNDINIQPNQIPQQFKNALLSIEDRQFYHEQGININRMLGAGVKDITNRNLSQGGSTITEQLVKMTYFPMNTKNFKSKLQQMYLSNQFSKHFSKNSILAMYMNRVYMGLGIYGMQTAAKFYFNKTLNKLDLSQCALLAGMVQSPSEYEPYNNTKISLSRRNTVLKTMLQNHKINHVEYQNSINEPLNVISQAKQRENDGNYFKHQLIADNYTTNVIDQLKQQKIKLNHISFDIDTPLNFNLQKYLLHTVNSDSSIPWPDNKLQTAVTIMDNKSGNVIAQVGGRHQHTIGGFNRAVSSDRSTGSAIKPIIDYAPAFDYLHWDPTTKIEDEPYKYPGSGISVHDWDNKYMGKIPISEALSASRNIPAVKTLAQTGMPRANSVMKKAGLGKQKDFSNAIGIYTSTQKLADAFSSIANMGNRNQSNFIQQITNPQGQTISSPSSNQIQVMSPQTAFMLTSVLQNVPKPNQLAPDAYVKGLSQAGKTGTAGYANNNNNMPNDAITDAWYVGYTKQYTIAVWTGYDDLYNRHHYLKQSNANISQLIYRKMINYLDKQPNVDKSKWSAPDKVSSHKIKGKIEYKWGS